MEDIYLYIVMFMLWVLQIGCLFAKKVWVRLLPAMITVVLMAFCVVMYAISGFTNWGYLILLLLLFLLLAAIGVVWLVYGIVRRVRKRG